MATISIYPNASSEVTRLPVYTVDFLNHLKWSYKTGATVFVIGEIGYLF